MFAGKAPHIDRWLLENQGKHTCQCGCGRVIQSIADIIGSASPGSSGSTVPPKKHTTFTSTINGASSRLASFVNGSVLGRPFIIVMRAGYIPRQSEKARYEFFLKMIFSGSVGFWSRFQDLK